ncbi:hypothetical protein BH20ACI1_BH20ACI1_29550 [soil metagenome]
MNMQLAEKTNGYDTNDKLDFLRNAAFALLEEVKSLASPKRLEFEEMINFSEEVRRFEIYLIEIALDKTNGNQFQAAQMLNLKHTTLNGKIKRYRISPIGRQAQRNGKSIGRHN